MKIALFGGAFDPVHRAHLAVAREAATRFQLDRVLFVPASRPPHKPIEAPYEDRYRMLCLALEGQPGFEPSRLEAGDGQSYSIDTIERLLPLLSPGDQLFFLIGADAFAEIRTWKRWRNVAAAVRFIVVSRPGHSYAVPEETKVERLDSLELATSSSAIRGRLAAGERPGELDPRVLDYIRARALYCAGAAGH